MKATKELLKGQFTDCIEECYIEELRKGYSKYNNCSLLNLLEHVNTKYASLDNHVLKYIMERFIKVTDLAVLLDEYKKQAEYQRQVKNTNHKTKDADIFLKLQEHMGTSGALTQKKIKFGKKSKALQS